MKLKKPIKLTPERSAAAVSTVLLALMAAGLLLLYSMTGYKPLLLAGLIQTLPAVVQLSLLLPVWKPKAKPEEPSETAEKPEEDKRAPAKKLIDKVKGWVVSHMSELPKLRKLLICAAVIIAIVVTHLIFWKTGVKTVKGLGYHLPVLMIVLFVGSMILEKWCRLCIKEDGAAYTNAQLRSLRTALTVGRIAQLLTAVTMTVKLLGIYDATAILNVLLGILIVYETVFIAFSLAVRIIRHELDTAPEFLIALPGMGKSNMGVIKYLEENTGITMRALWSMQLVKKVVPCAIFGIVLLIWLSTGLVQVEAHQEGALYRLGKLQPKLLEPGIHLTLPWPLDKVEVYDTQTLGRLTIGYIPSGEQDNIWTEAHGGEEYRLLLGNGDELISINLEIEYRISDLYSYIGNASNPEALLQAEAYEIITARTISSNLETMLSTDREVFSETFKEELSEHMAHHNTGIEVVNVVLESIHPPVEVADVYQNLIGAAIDAEHIIILAENEANDAIMKAKEEQTAKVGDAYVLKYQAVAEAEGAVAEFMASVAAYETYPSAYRYYKYMNTLTQAYAKAKLIIVGEGVDAEKLYVGSLTTDTQGSDDEFLEDYEEEYTYDEEY